MDIEFKHRKIDRDNRRISDGSEFLFKKKYLQICYTFLRLHFPLEEGLFIV